MKKGSLSPRRWGVCLAGGLTVNRWNAHGKQTCDTQEGEIKWLHADSQTEGHTELLVLESSMEIQSHPAASSVQRNVVQTLHESGRTIIRLIYLFIYFLSSRTCTVTPQRLTNDPCRVVAVSGWMVRNDYWQFLSAWRQRTVQKHTQFIFQVSWYCLLQQTHTWLKCSSK